MHGNGDMYEIALEGDYNIKTFKEALNSQSESIIAKNYKSYWSLTGKVEAKNSYEEELTGVGSLSTSLGEDVYKCSPMVFLNFTGHKVVGAKVSYKDTIGYSYKYTTFFQRCEKSLEDMCKTIEAPFEISEFKNIILTILGHLKVIQARNIAHGDLKPANIMKCNGEWKLIDWNMWRELTYDNMLQKDGIKPKHRGSSPIYYLIHNFPYMDVMIKNYVDDFMLAQFHTHYFQNFKEFMKESIGSYSKQSISAHDQFELLKYNADLHSLGLQVYAINALYFKDDWLTQFARSLSIYNQNTFLNAESAYNALVTGQIHGGAFLANRKRFNKLRREKIYIGTRGGKYVIRNGKKVYVRDWPPSNVR